MAKVHEFHGRNKLPTDVLFEGVKCDGLNQVTVCRPELAVWILEPYFHVRNHSPDGFNWGYGGSGPAQLALALLMEVSGSEQIAGALYQDFKWEVVARLAGDWEIEESFIREWILSHFDLERFEKRLNHNDN